MIIFFLTFKFYCKELHLLSFHFVHMTLPSWSANTIKLTLTNFALLLEKGLLGDRSNLLFLSEKYANDTSISFNFNGCQKASQYPGLLYPEQRYLHMSNKTSYITDPDRCLRLSKPDCIHDRSEVGKGPASFAHGKEDGSRYLREWILA